MDTLRKPFFFTALGLIAAAEIELDELSEDHERAPLRSRVIGLEASAAAIDVILRKRVARGLRARRGIEA